MTQLSSRRKLRPEAKFLFPLCCLFPQKDELCDQSQQHHEITNLREAVQGAECLAGGLALRLCCFHVKVIGVLQLMQYIELGREDYHPQHDQQDDAAQ